MRKAVAKQNRDLAKRLHSRRPSYRLDHLVKERYPSFIDAVRDLDDPLTMVHLFAVLPAEATKGIPADSVSLARRLALEWQAWVVRNNALRKVFVSVKGYYFQAEVRGQLVTWLVPHPLAQVLPNDVDYRVMLTFLELHCTMVRFVLAKLYHDCQLLYPPALNDRLEQAAAGLQAIMYELADTLHSDGLQDEAESSDEEEEENDDDQIDKEGEEANPLVKERLESLAEKVKLLKAEIQAEGSRSADGEAKDPIDPVESTVAAVNTTTFDSNESSSVFATLFKGMTFFLGREVPKEQLLLVIRSFGGEAGWEGEGSPLEVSDSRITHQIMDRPLPSGGQDALISRFGGNRSNREFIQPQWVFDSANARVLVRSELYLPGAAPPPHLSPFVDEEEEGYVPEYGKQIKKLQEAAASARRRAAGLEGEGEGEGAFVGEKEVTTEGDGDDDLEAVETRYVAELAKEMGTVSKVENSKSSKKRAASEAAEDDQALKDVMMTRKNKKMYATLQKERATKKARVQELEARAERVKTRSGSK